MVMVIFMVMVMVILTGNYKGGRWSVVSTWGKLSCTVRRSVISGQYIANLGIMVRVSGLKSEKLTVQP